jgi:short-subunit dehydrogenase
VPQTVLITGASGGIGAALAKAYAAPGVTLVLWGRDRQRLDTVAAECRSRGAAAETESIDLLQMELLRPRLEQLDTRQPIDLAILNAGLGGTPPRENIAELPEQAYAIATVNFTSPIVAASILAERMGRRGRGQIVFMSSVAGTFPLPMAPTYSGSKAGLNLFAEALGMRVKKRGVTVTLIAPGFIDTAMSRGLDTPKPFLMTAEAGAKSIKRGIERRRSVVVLPWPFRFIRGSARFLPPGLTRAVLGRF